MNPLTNEFSALLQQISLGSIDLDQLTNADLSALKKVLTPKMSKYIPHTPTAKQAAFLLLDCEEAFYGGASLALDTPITTKRGVLTVGELSVGDQLLAIDGSWTTIEALTEITQPSCGYRLTFSTGETIWTDAEHQWECQIRRFSFSREEGSDGHTPVLLSETKILTSDQLLHEKLRLPQRGGKTWRISMPRALPMRGDITPLPINPYVLGVWLGDGTASNGQIAVGDSNMEELEAILATEGVTFSSHSEKPGSNCFSCVVPGLKSLLRQENLLGNKHIPWSYQIASREQRLALLQGLMDTDGSLRPDGSYVWGQTTIKHQQLLEDFKKLLRGLGINYNVTHTQAKLNGKLFPFTSIQFNPREQVCRLKYKQFHGTKRDSLDVFLHDVQKVSTGKSFRCLRVTHPRHLFLVGETLIPTHNCGGGKSDALLMGALQYVDVPGYSAILFRKTYADLTKPGALMDRAKEWLLPYPEVRWDEKEKKFTFYQEGTKIPVSTIQFGYLESPNDKYNYQGGEYQFIGFDELTHIAKANYIYMFSRLRRLKGLNVPLRVRGASNPPDDDGGAWVRDRFIIEGPREGRVFIPAGLDDNPFLDKESYEKTLDKLDPVTRARLREGNWEILRKGNMFKRDWFELVDTLPPYRRTVRWWDMAATDEEKAKKKNKSGEPDYTASMKVSEANGIYYIEDIIRVRKDPEGTEKIQHSTAVHDGYGVSIFEEQEPGSSGIAVISSKSRSIFKGYAYSGINSTGSKVDRASIASAAAGNGNIKVLRGCRNIDAFFDELESFPGGIHDDMVDCLSGCISQLGSTNPITGAPIIVQEHEDQTSKWLEDDLDVSYKSLGMFTPGQGYFSRFGT